MTDRMGFETNRRFVKDFHNRCERVEINGKVCNFRSQLEKHVAGYLELLRLGGHIKDWSFETTTFQFPDDKWLVDFDVRNNDDSFEYFEAKGMFDARSRRKLKLVFKYRPDAKITMVFQNKRDMQKARLSAKYCYRFCLLNELTNGII